MTHVDDYIMGLHSDAYACWVLSHLRLPAILKARFSPFMAEHKLFCSYKGKRYRCIGASRLGDVWITEDFTRDIGYDLRVDVAECSEWGAKP